MKISSQYKKGISTQIKMKNFSLTEFNVIKKLGEEFFVSNTGEPVNIRGRKIKYCLISPPKNYNELFSIEKDLIVLISEDPNFRIEMLDAVPEIIKRHKAKGIENICFLMVSEDREIQRIIVQYTAKESESRVIIPFTINEILTKTNDPYFIRNRFRNNFFSRDLFAFNNPLRTDTYFFGRNDLIHKLFSRFKAKENSGLFGLRKIGKTSIIFGLQRLAKEEKYKTVFVDCEHTSMNQSRWYQALKYLIDEIKRQNQLKFKAKKENTFTESQCGIHFENELYTIYKKLGSKPILLIFDEIEWITPGVAKVGHWRNGDDFIFFWQTLRAIFQKYDHIISYIIVGTNPKSVETSTINNVDNPIFKQVSIFYIPPFSRDQTREMVRKIGRTMGLKFEESIYGRLTDDFGGHPFLIRNLCSTINKNCAFERPIRINNHNYNEAKKIFFRDNSDYVDMVLNVLRDFYHDEYEMLKMLALGDRRTFNDFAELSTNYTNHLIGYNILDYNLGEYSFKVEAIEKIIIDQNKYQKLDLNIEQKWREISERRNSCEVKLRKLIKQQFIISIGESEGTELVLKIFGYPRNKKYLKLSFEDLFNPNKCEIYFDELRIIIKKKWQNFQGVFEKKQEKFLHSMTTINRLRADAHAKEISEDEFIDFRNSINFIESSLNRYFNA